MMVILDSQSLSWPACYGRGFCTLQQPAIILETDSVSCGHRGRLQKGKAIAVCGEGEGAKIMPGRVRGIISWVLEEGLRSPWVFLKNLCSATPFFFSVLWKFSLLYFFSLMAQNKRLGLKINCGLKIEKKKPSASAHTHFKRRREFGTKTKLLRF